MRRFFAEYDVLVLPASQVPPFPADQEYPTEIDGRPMASYLDWMRSAYLISVTGCPAISVRPVAPRRAGRSGSSWSPPTARTGGCSRSPPPSRAWCNSTICDRNGKPQRGVDAPTVAGGSPLPRAHKERCSPSRCLR